MKKFVYIFLCALLIASMAVQTFAAAQTEESTGAIPDSITIPEEVLAQIDLDDGERVLRVWDNIGFMYLMGTLGYDIETVMRQVANDERAKGYCFVMSPTTITRTYTDKGKLGVQPGDAETTDDIIRFFWELPAELEDFAIIRRVSEDIVVNNIYVLSSTYDGYSTGWIIYYDTDLGPYIYYDSTHYTQYLMPLEVFRQLAKDFIAADTPYTNLPNVQYIENYEEKYGRYDLNSNKFSLTPPVPAILWVVVAMVPIAAVGIGWYVKKRKSRKEGKL